jgi:hypothetical protein
LKDNIVTKTKNLCARTLEELSCNCYVFGEQVRRQINKWLIFKGGPWGSLAFQFADKDGIKLMLASFKSDKGLYRRHSYFIIRNKEEAKRVCEIIKEAFNVEN